MADREKVIKEAEEELEYLAPDDKHRLHMGIMMKLGWIYDVLSLLKEQEPMTPEEFKDGLLKMFSSIWECEIDHLIFHDTVGELMGGVMQLYKKAVKWND